MEDSIIDIDIDTEKGAFWNISGLTFEKYFSMLSKDVKDIVRIRYKRHLFILDLYRHRYRREIVIMYSDCVVYNLKQSPTTNEGDLTSFSTECEDFLQAKINVQKKTEYVLTFIDAMSSAFGVDQVFLVDAATSTLNREIDLSLYMVMKFGMTFYERYGYKFCDKKIDFNVQKRLLQDFRFDVFYLILNPEQKSQVDHFLMRLVKQKTEYKSLGSFYVDVYDYYHQRLRPSKIIKLQKILNDTDQPWFSMVNILTMKKECMVKVV
jgi:hypothetical protein